jgi:fumarate hydratase class II
MAQAANGFRIEHDTMGEVRVPASARWGAQTQRAVENFPISGYTVGRDLIAALASIKGCMANENGRRRLIPADVAEAIGDAAAEVARGGWDDRCTRTTT